MSHQHGNFQKHTNPNPIQKYLLEQFHQHISDIISTIAPLTLLDAGCGEGFTGQFLREEIQYLDMIGVDFSPQALLFNRQEGMSQAPLSQSDVHHLPFPDNSFEMVMCLEVLEHLPDSSLGLQELLRVSKHYVLLSVPHEPFFRGANFLRGKHLKDFGNDPEHLHNYSGRNFGRLVSIQANVLRHDYRFPWQIVLAAKY